MKLIFLSLFLFAGCLTQTAEELRSGKEYTGIDINGEQRTCKEQLNGACTAIFGPDEQFANDCEAIGSQAVQCACHDLFVLVTRSVQVLISMAKKKAVSQWEKIIFARLSSPKVISLPRIAALMD